MEYSQREAAIYLGVIGALFATCAYYSWQMGIVGIAVVCGVGYVARRMAE